MFSYKKIKLTPFIFFRSLLYTLFSTIFIVFMIFFILINFKGVNKKISKRKKSEEKIPFKIVKIILICNLKMYLVIIIFKYTKI